MQIEIKPPADVEIKTPADAAFLLLRMHRDGVLTVSRRYGQFLGQLIASDAPLSDKQADWLAGLMGGAGLPDFQGGE